MQLTNSLDWHQIENDLSQKITNLGYNRDLNRVFLNIKQMVTELSQLEVESRRTKKEYLVKPQIDKINDSLKQINKFIVLLRLSKVE